MNESMLGSGGCRKILCSSRLSHSLFAYDFRVHFPHTPGRTVRADIRLDIRKVKNVRVELSVQPRISVLNRTPICVARTDICLDIGVTNFRARTLLWISVVVRIVRHGHP